MNFPDQAFSVIDWASVASLARSGERGRSISQNTEVGDLRVRMVEYTPGYVADHWCDRGHVLLVLEGELISELQDGRRFVLTAGMSYQVSDSGDSSHRSSSLPGAKLFIVD
ncbi:DHCW motif cupin fold protein [Sphingomonas sp. UYP23]